ncbi:hypothetical protein [Thermococcus sp. Bubb.Bath]|nr:hypothetical protein [Thermococcus sp. Bubb.Bath]
MLKDEKKMLVSFFASSRYRSRVKAFIELFIEVARFSASCLSYPDVPEV